MHSSPNPLPGFLRRALLWLPVTFACWYYLAPLLIWPLATLTQAVLGVVIPGAVESVQLDGRQLVVFSALEVTVPDGRIGLAVLSIDPLIYAYNLPLLIALMLAAGEDNYTLSRMLVSYASLLPFQTWGVSFDVLKQAALQLGPGAAEQLALGRWHIEAIALGYQFGFLILPVISGTAVWILLNRRFINSLLVRDAPADA